MAKTLTSKELTALITEGRSREIPFSQLAELRVPYLAPHLRRKIDPEFTEIDEYKKPIKLECCDICAPAIWENSEFTCTGKYVCEYCGKEVETILIRKKIERWW